jgi:hypothetical protein
MAKGYADEIFGGNGAARERSFPFSGALPLKPSRPGTALASHGAWV